MEIGIKIFNEQSPQLALEYLHEAGLLERDALSVGEFIRNGIFEQPPTLDKAVVADYLGERESAEVLKDVVASFNFANTDFEASLRFFCEHLPLPATIVKMERVLAAFAFHYSTFDPSLSADTWHKLTFAVVSLAHDLHHGVRPCCLTLREFAACNSGLDDGNDVDAHLLSMVYRRIAAVGLNMKEWEDDSSSILPYLNANKQGWLKVRTSPSSGWRRWWVVLKAARLYSLQSVPVWSEDCVLTHVFELNDIHGGVVSQSNTELRVTANGLSLDLQAITPEECAFWLSALTTHFRAIETAGSDIHVVGSDLPMQTSLSSVPVLPASQSGRSVYDADAAMPKTRVEQKVSISTAVQTSESSLPGGRQRKNATTTDSFNAYSMGGETEISEDDVSVTTLANNTVKFLEEQLKDSKSTKTARRLDVQQQSHTIDLEMRLEAMKSRRAIFLKHMEIRRKIRILRKVLCDWRAHVLKEKSRRAEESMVAVLVSEARGKDAIARATAQHVLHESSTASASFEDASSPLHVGLNMDAHAHPLGYTARWSEADTVFERPNLEHQLREMKRHYEARLDALHTQVLVAEGKVKATTDLAKDVENTRSALERVCERKVAEAHDRVKQAEDETDGLRIKLADIAARQQRRQLKLMRMWHQRTLYRAFSMWRRFALGQQARQLVREAELSFILSSGGRLPPRLTGNGTPPLPRKVPAAPAPEEERVARGQAAAPQFVRL